MIVGCLPLTSISNMLEFSLKRCCFCLGSNPPFVLTGPLGHTNVKLSTKNRIATATFPNCCRKCLLIHVFEDHLSPLSLNQDLNQFYYCYNTCFVCETLRNGLPQRYHTMQTVSSVLSRCHRSARKRPYALYPISQQSPKAALQTVPMFVWIKTNRSRLWWVERRPLPFFARLFSKAISAVIV